MAVHRIGRRDARIESPFMMFKNKDRHYPIQGTIDELSGDSYCTGPKGWMDQRAMVKWILGPRVIKALPSMRHRILFVNNGSR